MTTFKPTSRLWHGAAALLLTMGIAAPAAAQEEQEEPLTVNISANSLGVHIPYMAALNEIFPEMGHPKPEIQRVKQLSTITQSVLSGQTDLAAGDAISTLRAVEAGADLEIIGNAFLSTDLIFVVNSDKIGSLQDVEKDNVTLAVNSKGDFTHIMLVGPLTDAGVNMEDVNLITMGGSGNRMRALLAGRVDGVPLHPDQATEVQEQGNFDVLIRPNDFYDAFLGEVWIVADAWLEEEQNREIAVDVLKATIRAFRRTHDDFQWYAEMYRKYGTDESMADASDETIRTTYEFLVNNNIWPRDMGHEIETYEQLMPIYEQAGAVEGSVDPSNVVNTELVQQALSELGQG